MFAGGEYHLPAVSVCSGSGVGEAVAFSLINTMVQSLPGRLVPFLLVLV